MDKIELSATGKLKVGVLISGRGSNLQALIDACKTPDFPAEICVVISDRASAAGLKRAKKENIPAETITRKDFADKTEFESEIDKTLKQHGVTLVCLAGFMRILSPWLIERWSWRIINMHPSLLPDFKGLSPIPQREALKAGVEKAGCTVHFVTPELDAGPTVLQNTVPVLPDDTEDSLIARILTAEHQTFPAALEKLAQYYFHIKDDGILWKEYSHLSQDVTEAMLKSG